MRTVDGVSPAVTAGAVGSSLVAFVIVYGLIFPAGVYYMIRLVQRGPEPLEEGPARAPGAADRAAAPVRRRADLRARGVGAMAELGIDLPLLWAAIIVVGVVMYVLLDGFDLGVGILFPFLPTDQDRDLAMNSVAPIWDGNETWLVLGGAGLLAAFPLAYAVILPGTYLPLIVMLLGLIFRGVAFEFRFKAGEQADTSGTSRSITARSPRPSPRAWCSGPSSRASRSRTASSPAACSTG